MKKTLTAALFALFAFLPVSSQKKVVNLPDIPGYVTLKCDFHTHTVFSDGLVWPTYRLKEAYEDGLDALAITDHLEYTPNKDYVKTDFNAGWKLTEKTAAELGILLVHGAEITRGMPPGHFNALFIKDAEALKKDSFLNAVEEAIKQGAFIQWNHPGWKAQQSDGIPRMYDVHRKLIANGWLHGIEYFNDNEYYPQVFTICEQNKLTLTGNSDVHGIISESYQAPAYTHRPMTLVLARERTENALKEALFAGRTLVYFRDMLVGREVYAKPFFEQCVSVGKPYYDNDRKLYLNLTNRSDLPFYLINGPEGAPASITLEANSVTRVVLDKKVKGPLVYDVRNVLTGENTMLRMTLDF